MPSPVSASTTLNINDRPTGAVGWAELAARPPLYWTSLSIIVEADGRFGDCGATPRITKSAAIIATPNPSAILTFAHCQAASTSSTSAGTALDVSAEAATLLARAAGAASAIFAESTPVTTTAETVKPRRANAALSLSR